MGRDLVDYSMGVEVVEDEQGKEKAMVPVPRLWCRDGVVVPKELKEMLDIEAERNSEWELGEDGQKRLRSGWQRMIGILFNKALNDNTGRQHKIIMNLLKMRFIGGGDSVVKNTNVYVNNMNLKNLTEDELELFVRIMEKLGINGEE